MIVRIGCLSLVILLCLAGWMLLPSEPIPYDLRKSNNVTGPGNPVGVVTERAAADVRAPALVVPAPDLPTAPDRGSLLSLENVLKTTASGRAAEFRRLQMAGYVGADLLDQLQAGSWGRTRCAEDVWQWLVESAGERGAIARLDQARAAVLARWPWGVPAPGCLGDSADSQLYDLFWR